MSVTLSFEADHASQYGIEAAVILFHFRHWIEVNHVEERNNFEGRTWTYQSIKALRVHFPFISKSSLDRTLKKLTDEGGPMVKGNFNKSKYDRTVWYAFRDQDNWIRDRYKLRKCISHFEEMESPKVGNGLPQIGEPIPDNTTDNTTDILDPPSPQRGKVPTEVETLYNHFLEKIKEKNPTFKVQNPKAWKDDLDKLLRIDKRSLSDILSMIDWVSQDAFWKSNILSPAKLREKFSELEIKRIAQIEKNTVERNKKYCLQAKAKYPQELKDLVLTSTYAMNKANGKDVSLNWPFERFRAVFIAIFGGEAHG